MKILIINEYFIYGGAEEIARTQMNLLKEHGHSVYFLFFSKGAESTDCKTDTNIKCIKASKINKIIFNPFLYVKLRNYIKKINPDKIILHNLFTPLLVLYHLLGSYESYQVVHDYSIVCPTFYCVKKRGIPYVCAGYKTKNCLRDCGKTENKCKFIYKLYITKYVEKLRKKNINLFISPSLQLNIFLKNNGYQSTVINNPICVNKMLSKRRVNILKNHFIFAGGLAEHKGIFKFCEDVLSENVQCYIDIYGNDGTHKDKQIYNIIHKRSHGRIRYLGRVNHDRIQELLQDDYYDYLIVPSMWMENYPTIILEAMSNGLVVIGSNRGGIPEMLSNNKGKIFDYLDKDDLVDKINECINMNDELYESIRRNAYRFICENNNLDKYYEDFSNKINLIR